MTAEFAADEMLASTRFGTIAYRAEAVVIFPNGLPGFPAARRFLCAPLPGADGPFQLLHALDGEPVDLIVLPLESLGERVATEDLERARAELEIAAADLLVLCVVTLPARGSGAAPRVNLRAPIFVDVARRIGAQTVLANATYPFRETLRAA